MLMDQDEAAERASAARSVAIIFQHAQYVVPAADIGSLGSAHGARLVRLLDWAQNPYIKRLNIAFCLVADKLGEVNSRLVQNPYVATIDVPMPATEERARFVRVSGGSRRRPRGRERLHAGPAGRDLQRPEPRQPQRGPGPGPHGPPPSRRRTASATSRRR